MNRLKINFDELIVFNYSHHRNVKLKFLKEFNIFIILYDDYCFNGLYEIVKEEHLEKTLKKYGIKDIFDFQIKKDNNFFSPEYQWKMNIFRILHQKHPNAVITQEISLKRNVCDILLIDDDFYLFEIKTDTDSTSRLKKQLETYNQFGKSFVISNKKLKNFDCFHLDNNLNILKTGFQNHNKDYFEKWFDNIWVKKIREYINIDLKIKFKNIPTSKERINKFLNEKLTDEEKIKYSLKWIKNKYRSEDLFFRKYLHLIGLKRFIVMDLIFKFEKN